MIVMNSSQKFINSTPEKSLINKQPSAKFTGTAKPIPSGYIPKIPSGYIPNADKNMQPSPTELKELSQNLTDAYLSMMVETNSHNLINTYSVYEEQFKTLGPLLGVFMQKIAATIPADGSMENYSSHSITTLLKEFAEQLVQHNVASHEAVENVFNPMIENFSQYGALQSDAKDIDSFRDYPQKTFGLIALLMMSSLKSLGESSIKTAEISKILLQLTADLSSLVAEKATADKNNLKQIADDNHSASSANVHGKAKAMMVQAGIQMAAGAALLAVAIGTVNVPLMIVAAVMILDALVRMIAALKTNANPEQELDGQNKDNDCMMSGGLIGIFIHDPKVAAIASAITNLLLSVATGGASAVAQIAEVVPMILNTAANIFSKAAVIATSLNTVNTVLSAIGSIASIVAQVKADNSSEWLQSASGGIFGVVTHLVMSLKVIRDALHKNLGDTAAVAIENGIGLVFGIAANIGIMYGTSKIIKDMKAKVATNENPETTSYAEKIADKAQQVAILGSKVMPLVAACSTSAGVIDTVIEALQALAASIQETQTKTELTRYKLIEKILEFMQTTLSGIKDTYNTNFNKLSEENQQMLTTMQNIIHQDANLHVNRV